MRVRNFSKNWSEDLEYEIEMVFANYKIKLLSCTKKPLKIFNAVSRIINNEWHILGKLIEQKNDKFSKTKEEICQQQRHTKLQIKKYWLTNCCDQVNG